MTDEATMSPDAQRDMRAARNEDLFRRLNERLLTLTQFAAPDVDEPDTTHERFVCECASASCSRVVELTPDEYRGVRAKSTSFLIYPDGAHTMPELERVVERHARYWIVEKYGAAGAAAEALDAQPVDPL